MCARERCDAPLDCNNVLRHRSGTGEPHDRLHDGKRVPLDVKDADTILFGKYSGQEIKIDGEDYLIMREDEVLAVLESK